MGSPVDTSHSLTLSPPYLFPLRFPPSIPSSSIQTTFIAEGEASNLPLGEMDTGPLPERVAMDLPVDTSHSLTSVCSVSPYHPDPAETSSLPSREKDKGPQAQRFSCVAIVVTCSSLDTSHSSTVPFWVPEASSLPSREKTTDNIGRPPLLLSLETVATCSPLDTSHSLTKESNQPPEASSLPSGEKDKEETPPTQLPPNRLAFFSCSCASTMATCTSLLDTSHSLIVPLGPSKASSLPSGERAATGERTVG